jgi:putative aldouronate transport system permease protein
MASVSRRTTLRKSFRRHGYLYALLFGGFAFFVVFKYLPMFGIVIAFKNYKPWEGILGSEWVGFYWFERFFTSRYAWRLVRNTLVISFAKLLFGFPIPILFAILLNEIRSRPFKRVAQTVSYFPHFLSWVISGGLFIMVLSPSSGMVNKLIVFFGGEPIHFLLEPRYFRSILVLTAIWKSFGWGSIIYLAAIAGIDPQLYEAARMDGARKWHEILHITIPAIIPVATIMLVLQLGRIMNEDFQQILIFLRNNPLLYEKGDVLETYVYRAGILEAQYSFASAVEVFKNLTGLVLVMVVNRVVKALGQEALW